MFSFIMAGGKFPFYFDRYIDVALNKKDIFDIHKRNQDQEYDKINKTFLSIDAKKNHVKKIKEIGFSKIHFIQSWRILN